MNNRYGTLASWVYNLDKPVGRSFGDVEYYRQHLGEAEGSILEPAVGNGRVYVPLLESGFSIEGFDASNDAWLLPGRMQEEKPFRKRDTTALRRLLI